MNKDLMATAMTTLHSAQRSKLLQTGKLLYLLLSLTCDSKRTKEKKKPLF
jgi:hypothetical protein